jgi:hypothetical protein
MILEQVATSTGLPMCSAPELLIGATATPYRTSAHNDAQRRDVLAPERHLWSAYQ